MTEKPPKLLLPPSISYYKKEIKRLREVIRDLSPSIEALLRKRGLKIYTKEPSQDLLIPEPAYIEDYYRKLHKYSFRLFLRDVIKFQKGFTAAQVTHYATEKVTKEYISYLKNIKLVDKFPDRELFFLTRPVKSFGETLEWFFSEILKREFLMDSIWGIRFKRPAISPEGEITAGGDYDVIAKFNNSILYAEIKSSPPKQIYQKEIKAFLKRIKTLSPELSIFFMDTELRMKDKIVPMFEEELRNFFKEPPPVERIKKEIFHIANTLYIMNSKDSIIYNIEIVLSWYHKYKHRGLNL